MLLKFIFNRKKRKEKKKNERKFDIKSWMELTKEERLEIDLRDKNELMKKKKALLNSIRDEYIKIKNKE